VGLAEHSPLSSLAIRGLMLCIFCFNWIVMFEYNFIYGRLIIIKKNYMFVMQVCNLQSSFNRCDNSFP
jgi:hypothetical protein